MWLPWRQFSLLLREVHHADMLGMCPGQSAVLRETKEGAWPCPGSGSRVHLLTQQEDDHEASVARLFSSGLRALQTCLLRGATRKHHRGLHLSLQDGASRISG